MTCPSPRQQAGRVRKASSRLQARGMGAGQPCAPQAGGRGTACVPALSPQDSKPCGERQALATRRGWARPGASPGGGHSALRSGHGRVEGQAGAPRTQGGTASAESDATRRVLPPLQGRSVCKVPVGVRELPHCPGSLWAGAAGGTLRSRWMMGGFCLCMCCTARQVW